MPAPEIKGRKVEEALRHLCETVLAGRQFKDANAKIESFLQDEDAKQSYLAYNARAAELRERQERGFDLTAGQVAEIEQLRKEIAGNGVIRGFMEASDELERIKLGALTWLEKAFEICRVPEDKDFADEDED